MQHVQRLQALVRREKDVIKLTCVNDSMVTIKAETNIFETRVAAFEAGLNANDWSSAFTAVKVSADKVHTSREEADRCVGDTELADSEASFRAPEIIDDPTQDSPYHDVLEPPAYASPYN